MKKGWQTKTLGEICDIERGGSPRPIQDFITTDPNGINWIKIGDATASGKYIYKTEEKIKPEGVKRSRMVYEGDFILSNSMSFGRPYIMKTKGCIHDGWLVLHQPKVDPDYLYHALSSDLVFDQFDRLAAGSTVRNLNIGLAKSVEIPYPPLAEQQRIVGLLDEAFEGLATAKANAEKNLQNARDLFESHLQSVFTQRGPGWVDTGLGELCEVFDDGDWVESKDQSPDGVRLIQTGNVGEGVFKDRADKARYISEATFKRLRCTEIFEGDCLISRLPDPVGRSCILPDTGERMITAVDCTIVRFDRKRLLPEFFNHYSQADDYLRTVAKECTGTTRNRISRSNLALTPIPVPPIAEQKRLANEFDTMREETQRLARLYERKHAALEALKKSLLHQAFTGQL